MANITQLEKTLPTAPLKIAVLDSCKELGQKVTYKNDVVGFMPIVPNSEHQSSVLFHT